MLSNEAIAFDFPELDPQQAPFQGRPNLILLQDTYTGDIINGAEIELDQSGIDALDLADNLEDSVGAAKVYDPEKSIEGLDTFKLYGTRLDGHSLLNTAQEEALLHRLTLGDPDAKHQLLLGHQRLIVAISKKFYSPDHERMDFIQAGMLGAYKAAEKFNIFRGRKFAVLAGDLIRNAMREAVYDSQGLTSTERIEISNLRKIDAELAQRLGRIPTRKELAAASGIDEAEVNNVRAIATSVFPLDIPVHEDPNSIFKDLIPSRDSSPHDVVAAKELTETIQTLINRHLNPREAVVIRGVFGMNDRQISLTERELADQLGVNKSRVGQIKSRALEKLEGPIATYRAGAEVPDVKKFTEGITGIA